MVRLRTGTQDLRQVQPDRNQLCIVDDIETATDHELIALIDWLPQMGVLFAVGRRPIERFPGDQFQLGELTQAETCALLSSVGFEETLLAKLGDAAWTRTPFTSTLLANHLLRQGSAVGELLDPSRARSLFEALNDIARDDAGATIVSPRHALLDPDGRPIQELPGAGTALISDIDEISDGLIALLAREPASLYLLTPRRFEKLVAELNETRIRSHAHGGLEGRWL